MHRAIVLLSAILPIAAAAQTQPLPYHIYAGNTHSHTSYTWSHGDQFNTNGCVGILVYAPKTPGGPSIWGDGYVKASDTCAGIYVIDGLQYPAPGVTPKPDWEKFQGPPATHFEIAKAAGYDFYTTTDHSQDADVQSGMPNWLTTKRVAAQATSADFLALAGFEYSENDGPGGTGHLGVINSDDTLNALLPGVGLQDFYKWLKTARPNGAGPVLATFNHPDREQYNNWDYRDPQLTNILTMLEVINSNNKIHYDAFVNALDHGWKVSPVCGNDNHGTGGITKQTSRTFVLATDRSKTAILDAMKNRRTYAALDKNIQATYTVNAAIMGSTLNAPGKFAFDISITDPDTSNPKDKITKIDIVKDGGVVVDTFTPEPGYAIEWKPTITDSTSKYFFVRVWNAGGGDAPTADPAKPIAWLAPVWTGR